MTKMLGSALKPIPVDETLLAYLEPKQRLEFIKQWRTAAAEITLRRCASFQDAQPT